MIICNHLQLSLIKLLYVLLSIRYRKCVITVTDILINVPNIHTCIWCQTGQKLRCAAHCLCVLGSIWSCDSHGIIVSVHLKLLC